MFAKTRSVPLALFCASSLLVVGFSAAMLAACGSKNSPAVNPTVTPDQAQPGVAGSLTGVLNQLKASPAWQAAGCDAAFESGVRELVGALDARSGELAAVAVKQRQDKAASSAGALQVLDLGGSFLLHRNPPTAPSGRGWVSEGRGWAEVLAQFRKVKKNPTDATWVGLDAATRAMLSYDEMRLLYGENLNLGPNDQAGMQSLLSAYETCFADSTCVDPKLDANGRSERDSNPAYIGLARELHEAQTPAQKRQVIQDSLAKTLLRDAEPFVPRADHQAVTRTSTSTIEVALDPGTVITTTDGLNRAASAIESIWSSALLNVHVRWTRQGTPDGQGAFRIVLDPSPNEAPVTFFKGRTILIGPGRSDKSLAYEIGHVLGFGNHAFVDYSLNDCKYQIVSNDTDLMSVSSTGLVTSDEWNALESLYPVSTGASATATK